MQTVMENRLNGIFKPVIILTLNKALKPITQQVNTQLNQLNNIATTVNLLKAHVASRAKWYVNCKAG